MHVCALQSYKYGIEQELTKHMKTLKKLSKKSKLISKSKFRATKEWKEFRKMIIQEQKVDLITGSKLTKMANCHHLDMNAENYQNLIRDNFIALNPKSHDVIHFLFRPDWRERLDKIKEILSVMELINITETKV